MAIVALPAAAKTAEVAIQNSDKVGHVMSVAVARVLQAIIIFICVIVIIIGIIVLRYGSWVTGSIWLVIGLAGLGGTAWWARETSGFIANQPPQYQSYHPPPRRPMVRRRSTGSRIGLRFGFGEDAENTPENLEKLQQVGGDCGCGDDPVHDGAGDETMSRKDNIIPTPPSEKGAVYGSGETRELFHEEMLENGNITRDTGKKLKLKAQ